MSIKVKDFKWEKGKNDLEYITILERNLDAMSYKFKECSKVAKEQYNKGREDERAKIIDRLPKCHDETYRCELSLADCFTCMRRTIKEIEKCVKEDQNNGE